MHQHLVVGAGPVGTALTHLLVERGDRVTVVTRSGRGPAHPAVRLVAADASDAEALTALAQGARTVVNCANPGAYQLWAAQWPPLAAALLTAAERSGAVLLTTGNLYAYGPVDGPLTPDLPLAATGTKGRLRARMWQDALAAHEAGRVRAAEVRASDYVGPTAGAASALLHRYADALLAGKPASVFGDPDLPHTFTAVTDIARTLLAVADDERAWGRPWHVPSPEPLTVRAALTDLLAASGTTSPVRLRRFSRTAVTALSPVVPVLRELREVLWQWERPFVLDATATTAALGVHATPWPRVADVTGRAWGEASARRADATQRV
jgi:nucleoside-diphosphate-sugar epimerase